MSRNPFIQALYEKRNELKESEKNTFKSIARDFMKKFNTDTIYFDYVNQDCPDYTFLNCDSDDQDALVKFIKFNEDGDIVEIYSYTYYSGEEVSGDIHSYDQIDYLELSEFVLSQFDERFIPEND